YALMNLLGSHDRVRILNAMTGYDRVGIVQMDRAEAHEVKLSKRELKSAKKKYLEALKLLCALPGAPTLYYGDEIGMTGMADPWNRAPMDWNGEDERLREEIAKLLRARAGTAVLQTGYLDIEALDEDTLKVRRFALDGKDVFGEALGEKPVAVRISRRL
ncbi:MAG: alpha-amylase family glycosyl hydrolase, partial [Clostridia bacterium]